MWERSGIDVRRMAEEAGCLDFYRYAYTPFSAGTHSMWHHISRWNLISCRNPLHRYHRVPDDRILNPDPDYLYLAAKYAAKTLDLFDEKSGVKVDIRSALDVLGKSLASFGREQEGKASHEKIDKA